VVHCVQALKLRVSSQLPAPPFRLLWAKSDRATKTDNFLHCKTTTTESKTRPKRKFLAVIGRAEWMEPDLVMTLIATIIPSDPMVIPDWIWLIEPICYDLRNPICEYFLDFSSTCEASNSRQSCMASRLNVLRAFRQLEGSHHLPLMRRRPPSQLPKVRLPFGLVATNA